MGCFYSTNIDKVTAQLKQIECTLEETIMKYEQDLKDCDEKIQSDRQRGVRRQTLILILKMKKQDCGVPARVPHTCVQ